MNCAEVREYLSEYVDARLSPQVHSVVDAHLRVCPACRKEYEKLESMRAQIKDLRLTDTSDFVFDWDRAKAPVKVVTFKRFVPYISAVAACCVLVVGVCAVMWKPKGESVPETNFATVAMQDDAEPAEAVVASNARRMVADATAENAVAVKRTVRISITDEQKEIVKKYLEKARLEQFDDETVLPVEALDVLLKLKGVSVLEDVSTSDASGQYTNMVAISY